MSVQSILVCGEAVTGYKNETTGRTCGNAAIGLKRGSTAGPPWMVKGLMQRFSPLPSLLLVGYGPRLLADRTVFGRMEGSTWTNNDSVQADLGIMRPGAVRERMFGELAVANKGTSGLGASPGRSEIKRRPNRLVNAWDIWGRLGLFFWFSKVQIAMVS